MSHYAITPLGAVGRGLLAGAAGTAAMTASQMTVMKVQGGSSSTVPGQVAQRVGGGVFKRKVPDEKLGMLTQVVHWAYGTAWGAAYGIGHTSLPLPTTAGGVLFGTVVWGFGSVAMLPAMQLSPPVWQRPPTGTAYEVGYHLVYGLAAALTYRALTPGRR